MYVNKNSRDNIYENVYIAFEKEENLFSFLRHAKRFRSIRSKETNHKSKLIHLETNMREHFRANSVSTTRMNIEIFTSDTPLRFHLIEKISRIEYLFDIRVIKHFAKLLFSTLTTSFERHKCSRTLFQSGSNLITRIYWSTVFPRRCSPRHVCRKCLLESRILISLVV